MITIDNRLRVCSEMVNGSGIVCDVGTDHAYLPAYLIENKICDYALASDINDGPLSFAEQTVKKYKFEDRIKLVKSDGLDKIPSENVSDIIIAGMGGETIVSILENVQWIKNLRKRQFCGMTRTVLPIMIIFASIAGEMQEATI